MLRIRKWQVVMVVLVCAAAVLFAACGVPEKELLVQAPFEMPEDLKAETGVDLTPEAKRKILGLNAAKLYGIDIEAKKAVLGAA